MAAQQRGSKGPGNRPSSKGNRPGQGSAKAAAKAPSAGKPSPAAKPVKTTKSSTTGTKTVQRPAQSSAQRRQAASKAVARARTGGGGNARIWWTVVPIAVIAAVVITLVAVKLAQDNKPKSGSASGIASAVVLKDVQSVPAAVANSIGIGGATGSSLKTLTGAALTADGKPRILYVGAEWCPYCAAERWALTVALSRFGTFSELGTTTSSPSDVDPSTATLSYHGAKYTSTSLVFTPYEMYSNQAEGNGYKTLDTVPAADMKLFESQGGGSFPYVSIGGKYMITGASYDPGALKGLSHEEIAQELSDASSPIAKDIVGTANLITAAICKTTNNAPSNVCTAAGVTAAAAKLPT